jgi:hypothetical protein
MVAEYDAASEPGAKGALLRREGLYSSHIIEWRRARDAGALAGVADRPRKPLRSDAAWEAERLRADSERLRVELAKLRRGRRWRLWEKRTRSWVWSPRARTPIRGR